MDHAPHEWDEKQLKYLAAPAGLPLVQYALVSLLEHVYNGTFTLEQVVHKVCHAPALGYGVAERGFIREGYWPDLVLVALADETLVSHDSVLYKCGWTPYDGHTFKGSIHATMVSGAWAYRDGEVRYTDIEKRIDLNV